jgi:hypothetical protein
LEAAPATIGVGIEMAESVACSSVGNTDCLDIVADVVASRVSRYEVFSVAVTSCTLINVSVGEGSPKQRKGDEAKGNWFEQPKSSPSHCSMSEPLPTLHNTVAVLTWLLIFAKIASLADLRRSLERQME